MTFLELQKAVQRFIKFGDNDPDMLTLCKDSINIALYDVAREAKWPELLIAKFVVSLVGVDTTGTAILPSDLIDINRVRYFSSSDVYEWPLFPRSGLVPPSVVMGKPRAYDLIHGNPFQILLEPFDQVIPSADRLRIDYWSIPTLLVNNGDTPVSNSWDTQIIKRAEHYMLTYTNKILQAKELWNSMLNKMSQQPTQQS